MPSTRTTTPTPVEVGPSPEGVPGAVTDPSRVSGEALSYAGAGGEQVAAYLARPVAGGPHPGLIAIHEAGGVNEHIRDVANRFANLGYVTLAPDLYTREGGPPPAGDLQALMARLFSMPDERVLGDLRAGVNLLREREDATGRVGCIGFCMGGRYTLLLACTSDRLDAAVDCWGGFIDAATPEERSTRERPTPPLELARGLRCPLLAAVGAEDHNPSAEVGERLREAVAGTGHETRVDVYEGAGHAFFADYRPTYRPEPAALLWERVVPFLARHLDGPADAAGAS
jgi:carboxymethylenebutenolidase